MQRAIAEQARADILVDEPPRDYAMNLCIQAWGDLNTCRTIGMVAGPIPWTAIAKWCEWHAEELDRSAAMTLIHVIRQLDIDRAEREAAKRAIDAALGAKP